MTTTWKIVNLERLTQLGDHTDVVNNVHWEAIDQDADGNSGRVYGSQLISTDDLSSFTAYEELTEDQVIAWVKEALGEDRVSEIETNIQDQIAELANPSVKNGTPW